MKVSELLQEFARSSGSGGDDGDIGDWKRISFKGETVYYRVSLFCLQQMNKGLSVQISVKPRAVNAESETAEDKSVDVHGKTRDEADDEAIKLVFKYLNKHGTDGLHKRAKDWSDHDAKYRADVDAKLSKAKTGKKSLPAGYEIVDGPKKGFRFVKTPDGKLIPNQGVNDYKTEQDIIDNFYAWRELSK